MFLDILRYRSTGEVPTTVKEKYKTNRLCKQHDFMIDLKEKTCGVLLCTSTTETKLKWN